MGALSREKRGLGETYMINMDFPATAVGQSAQGQVGQEPLGARPLAV